MVEYNPYKNILQISMNDNTDKNSSARTHTIIYSLSIRQKIMRYIF